MLPLTCQCKAREVENPLTFLSSSQKKAKITKMHFPFVSQNPTNQDQNPPPNSLQFNINSFLSSVQSSAHAVLSHICPVGPIPKPPSPAIPPPFARIPSRATRNTSSSSPSSQPAASLPMYKAPFYILIIVKLFLHMFFRLWFICKMPLHFFFLTVEVTLLSIL